MVVLVPIRNSEVGRHLAQAFAAANDAARLSPEQRTAWLQRTVAMCEQQVSPKPTYPPPPANAPLRAALTSAAERMVASHYTVIPDDPCIRDIHLSGMWNALRRHAEQRLAAQER